MSWLKENYEKAALGGAAVIALGVGAMILTSDAGEVTAEGGASNIDEYEVAETNALVAYNETLATTAKSEWQQHRDTDLTSFIAFPMYGKKGANGPIELSAEELFDGIPLKWWKENGLDDYQFQGAASKDSDDDGFSHGAEYKAGTNPNDVASHPDLLNKLKLIDSNLVRYRVQGSHIDADRVDMTFKYRKITNDYCKVGDLFPAKGQPKQFLNRFKLKSKGRAENPATGFEEDYYVVADTKKEGKTYKLWSSNGPMRLKDWIGKFKLNTPKGGAPFMVPEGGEFSLPYKAGGKGYKFLLSDKRDPKLKKLTTIEIRKTDGKPVNPVKEGGGALGENSDVLQLGLAQPGDVDDNAVDSPEL